MVVEVATAIESIKAAVTIARGINALNDRTAVNSAVIDIQGHLLTTQQAMLELQDLVQSLKTKIAELERFSPERYELAEVAHGGHAWSGRRAYRDRETGTYYCPGCFSEGKLKPLQFNGTIASACAKCGTSLGWADDHRLSV